jgi:hypothetical protein
MTAAKIMRTIFFCLLLIFIGVVIASCSSAPPVVSPVTAMPSASPAVVRHVAQTTSLSLKATVARIGCGNYTDTGAAMNVFVKDSGSCYIGSKKYGTDSFPSQIDRDAWLMVAKGYGVDPSWESATVVVYPSITS